MDLGILVYKDKEELEKCQIYFLTKKLKKVK